jgi:hypothetical protein
MSRAGWPSTKRRYGAALVSRLWGSLVLPSTVIDVRPWNFAVPGPSDRCRTARSWTRSAPRAPGPASDRRAGLQAPAGSAFRTVRRHTIARSG